jgi:hypothetical protein
MPWPIALLRPDLERLAARLFFDLVGHECGNIILPHQRFDAAAIPALPKKKIHVF